MLNLIRLCDIVSLESKLNVIENYACVFTGTGEFPDEPYHIVLKDNAVPVVHPPRRVPQALHLKLKQTLDKLEEAGIVSKVNKPTDWVQSLVIVEKPNGNLRLCLDPRDLNKVIKREHYQIPSADDIISRLEGKKIFSVLDLKDGFWHVPLDESSSEICTFNTPFGRYKFNKMPFGIVSAPEVFQKRNQKLLGDIEGVEVYFDDIIITGYDKASHDKVMYKVLERAKSLNIKFNPDKFQFRVPEVKYLGLIISSAGIKVDPGHIKGIMSMPTPSSKTQVRRLLGMINFLSKFLPNVSKITAPLREIIHEKVEFYWGEKQNESFNKIKELLTRAPVLKVFNANEEIIIQCDSSKDGLGACLIQNGQPISFISRSLTKTEKNYAQIEKELLAIVFSFEKYHNFVYGHKVMVQSDHRPLSAIINKPMHKITTRMQRMILKLLKYEFEIKYVPGNQMFLADTLSRAFPKDEIIKDDPEMLNVIHSISKHLPMSENRFTQFKQETESDAVLQRVIKYIKEGWPKSSKLLQNEIKLYYKFKNDLNIHDGLVFNNEKIVVPFSFQKNMLKLIHEAHFGIEKCKKRARELMYWPGMNSDIEKLVSHCEICEKFRRANCKEPLKPHSVPYRPFEKIGVDIMTFGSVNFLVIIDYYSKWLEVCEMKNTSASEVIDKLKSIFSVFGVPHTVVSDNVPFNSYVYKKFANEWDFNYAFISPHFSQSNGMAERGVGIAKSIFRKAKEDEKDIYTGLMEYRNTPISGLDLSPAQIMFNRRLKTKLPITNKLLNSELFENIREKLVERQKGQKLYYDKTAHPLSELTPGENVRILNFKQKTWEPAKIISKEQSHPRSYYVQDRVGKCLRRNRKHIRKSNNNFIEETYLNDDIIDSSLQDRETPVSNIRDQRDNSLQGTSVSVGNTQNINNRHSTRIRRRPAYLNDYELT